MDRFNYENETQFTLSTLDNEGTVVGTIKGHCQVQSGGECQVIQVILTGKTGNAPPNIPLNLLLIAKCYDPAYILGEADEGFSTTGREKAEWQYESEFKTYSQHLRLLGNEKLTPVFYGAFDWDQYMKIILLEYLCPPRWVRLDEHLKTIQLPQKRQAYDLILRKMQRLQDTAKLCIRDIATRNIFVSLKSKAAEIESVAFIDFARVLFEPAAESGDMEYMAHIYYSSKLEEAQHELHYAILGYI